MKTTRCLIIALLVASPVAFAQVSGNLNAAGGMTNRVLPPTQPPAGAGANADRPLPPDAATVVSTTLNTPNTIRDIQSTSFEARKPLLNEVSNRIDAGQKLASSLERDPRAIDAEVRTSFNSALEDVKVKEKMLKRSLKEARKASNADAWSVAQITLAADYEAYATSVALLNAIIGK